jgi:Co/Zn/Cd efflux system component
VWNTFREKEKQDLCLLKRSIKTLLKKHPEGMTLDAICRQLLRDAGFSGTYRNRLSQTNSILRILIDEEKIRCSGSGRDRIYAHVG